MSFSHANPAILTLADDKFPVDIALPCYSAAGPATVDLAKEFHGKTVMVTSSMAVLDNVDKFRAKGVDRIIVVSGNEPSENSAYAHAHGYEGAQSDYVIFAQDPEGSLSAELGENYVTGRRPSLYSALVDDGHVTYMGAEEKGASTDISSGESILSRLGDKVGPDIWHLR